MKKIADFIVKKRILILVTVLILTGVCGFLIPKVGVNTDMTKYLPDSSSMKIGMDIMEEAFPDAEEDYTIRVMFKGLTAQQKTEMQEKLAAIPYVTDVDFKPDDADYNRGEYTKYLLHTEHDYGTAEELSVEQALTADFSQHEMQYKNDSTDGPDLPTWVVITAVSLLTLILVIMSGSWIEPFLFLFTIGIAVAVNLGTNIFLGEISEKTFSVAAILQLVLSIDYCIILTNRYRQELAGTADKESAMQAAITGAFSSISSSSLTTVVGLLAMVFMSFKIGFDMGVVLAKGVFLSVVCVFLVLPGLLLMFSRLLEKTAKRAPNIPTGGLARLCSKLRVPLTLCFAALFAGAYILQQRTAISYYMGGEDPIAEIFPTSSTVVLLYDNRDDEQITALAEILEQQDNVKSAANYSNTLAKQHTAADMIDAIDDLSENMGSGKKREIDPDESLFNMLYYKYYGGETGTITAGEFMRFLTEEVLTNETFKDYISDEMTENADTIKKLSDAAALRKPMRAPELADFFGMKRTDCEQLYLYYFIRHQGAETKEMTVGQFVDFVLNDLANDKDYADLFDEEMLSQMTMLQRFTDKETLQKECTAEEIAEMLSMKEEDTELLFVYYYANQNSYKPKTMTIRELLAFLQNDIAADPAFSAYFQGDTAEKLTQLAAFTDTEQITARRDAAALAKTLNMEPASVQQLFRMDTGFWDYEKTAMPITEFTAFLSQMMQDPTFGSGFDEAAKANLGSMKQITDTAASGQALPASVLAQILQMDEGFVTQLFMGYSAQTGQEITAMPLTDFVEFLVTAILPNPDYAPYFDAETAANLGMMQQLCRTASADAALHASEYAQMFGMEESQIKTVFALYYSTDDRTMSLYEFVSYLQSDVLKNPAMAAGIDAGTAGQIGLLKNIMDLALYDKGLRSQEAAALFDMDADTMKLLYALKESRNAAWRVTPADMIAFLSSSKETLSSMADAETMEQIDLLKRITDAAAADEALDEKRLAELTGMKEDQAEQLFLLYTYQNSGTAGWKLSAEQFIGFLTGEVLGDPEISGRFGADDRKKLTGTSAVIRGVISGKQYTSKEMTALFEGITEDIDANAIELMYLYYAANKPADNTKTMSVDQLMNYLNDTLIHDDTFKTMLDAETVADIKQNAADLNDGSRQLRGEQYSRLILSATVPEEGEETRAFYDSIHAACKSLRGEYHLIGSSAMNDEMSRTFGREYLLITLLTAAAIFLVVLLTFRSLAVPAILVLLVQCGVYITVTVIGFQGYSIHYLALMIVQCILMGSTIDYGILFSNYYRESRRTAPRGTALQMAFQGSIHTILTSGLIIVTVTAILGQCFGEPTVEQICQTISIGAASAILLILFILPGILACLDRFTAGKHRLR